MALRLVVVGFLCSALSAAAIGSDQSAEARALRLLDGARAALGAEQALQRMRSLSIRGTERNWNQLSAPEAPEFTETEIEILIGWPDYYRKTRFFVLPGAPFPFAPRRGYSGEVSLDTLASGAAAPGGNPAGMRQEVARSALLWLLRTDVFPVKPVRALDERTIEFVGPDGWRAELELDTTSLAPRALRFSVRDVETTLRVDTRQAVEGILFPRTTSVYRQGIEFSISSAEFTTVVVNPDIDRTAR